MTLHQLKQIAAAKLNDPIMHKDPSLIHISTVQARSMMERLQREMRELCEAVGKVDEGKSWVGWIWNQISIEGFFRIDKTDPYAHRLSCKYEPYLDVNDGPMDIKPIKITVRELSEDEVRESEE